MHRLWKRFTVSKNYRQWWKRNWWWLLICLTAFVTIYVMFTVGNWAPWMGFRGKIVWEWLQLLGVPLTLAVLGYFLQQQEQRRSRDEAKDEILDVYFDRLSALLVDQNLLAISTKLYTNDKDNQDSQYDGDLFPEEKELIVKDGDALRSQIVSPEQQELFDSAIDVVRARTLSILRRFQGDYERKTSVIQFLIEAEVISKARLNLSYSDLSEAILAGGRLEGAILTGANLTGTNLEQARLEGANLTGANLTGAILTGARLERANLSRVYLEGGYFTRVYIAGAYLEGAYLTSGQLTRIYIEGTCLSWANLTGANLEGANLEGVRLEGATLTGANLEGARLEGVTLTGAYLHRANFRGANLTGAYLEGANLAGFEFDRAFLEKVGINRVIAKGIDLEGADLSNIQWSSKTIWPDKEEVAKARNIPEKLKQELGIISSEKSQDVASKNTPDA